MSRFRFFQPVFLQLWLGGGWYLIFNKGPILALCIGFPCYSQLCRCAVWIWLCGRQWGANTRHTTPADNSPRSDVQLKPLASHSGVWVSGNFSGASAISCCPLCLCFLGRHNETGSIFGCITFGNICLKMFAAICLKPFSRHDDFWENIWQGHDLKVLVSLFQNRPASMCVCVRVCVCVCVWVCVCVFHHSGSQLLPLPPRATRNIWHHLWRETGSVEAFGGRGLQWRPDMALFAPTFFCLFLNLKIWSEDGDEVRLDTFNGNSFSYYQFLTFKWYKMMSLNIAFLQENRVRKAASKLTEMVNMF